MYLLDEKLTKISKGLRALGYFLNSLFSSKRNLNDNDWVKLIITSRKSYLTNLNLES